MAVAVCFPLSTTVEARAAIAGEDMLISFSVEFELIGFTFGKRSLRSVAV